jgi:hypothetical protein
MAKNPTFRRQPVPTPPPSLGAAAPLPGAPGGGTLPLPSGQVSLTDYTRRQLEKLGWQEGDPIPGDLGKRIQKIQREIAEETATTTHGFPPGSKVKIGKTVNIDELPPERQQELRQHLAEYKEVMAQQEIAQQAQAAIEAQVHQTAEPSVQEAQRLALQAAQAQRARAAAQTAPGAPQGPESPFPEVVINTEARHAQQVATKMPPGLRPRPGATPVSADGIADFVVTDLPVDTPDLSPPQEETQEEPTAAEAPQEAGAGGDMPLERCPRCWWKLSDPFAVEPADRDRQMFVAAILGTTRFRKTVQLMNGYLSVDYRSLTSMETELLFQQLGIDLRAGLIVSDAEYLMRLQEYRLYMSIEAIANDRGERMIEIPPIHEIPYDAPETGQPEQTRLIEMKRWFNEEAVTSESLRRILAQHLREFQRLVEALEAQTDEPGFWTGIESPT